MQFFPIRQYKISNNGEFFFLFTLFPFILYLYKSTLVSFLWHCVLSQYQRMSVNHVGYSKQPAKLDKCTHVRNGIVHYSKQLAVPPS